MQEIEIKSVNDLPKTERLVAITYLEREKPVLLYQFAEGSKVINYQLEVPKNRTVESICHNFKAAVIFEAEILEMYNVKFDGNPRKGLFLEEA